MKFTLYNYSGQIHSHYKVEQSTLSSSTASIVAESTAHLILLVDRSGSMWGSMEKVKKSIEEVLTSEEAKGKPLLVSLLSYSSSGDVTIHFSRSPIATVSKTNSTELRSLRKISPTGLTSISNGLDAALSLVVDGETTMISLHSDGYANDDSSYSERQHLSKILDSNSNPDLSVHTIAHTSWSDFQTLSKIANSLSGTCVYARSADDVQQPLLNVLTNAIGPVEPPFVITKDEADLIVFLSPNSRRIITGEVDLMISGLPEGADKIIYRYTKIDKDTYDSLNVDVCGKNGSDNVLPIYLFSRAMLSLGRLSAAKYALITTRDNDLIANHYRALINEELAEMASEQEEIIFSNDREQRSYSTAFGFETMETSVLEITNILQKYSSAFEVDIVQLRKEYVRRTLQKIPGERDENGTFHELEYELRPVETDDFVEVVECTINQNTASINLTVSDPVQLFEKGNRQAILDIAGVDISKLRDFRTFTIVGDGYLNLSSLHVKISDKIPFQALKKLGLVSGTFSDSKVYHLDLNSRPLLPFNLDFRSINGIFDKVMACRTLHSALRAMLKNTSTIYTGEQIAALRKHHITPSLNISLPSTIPYSNLDDAISNGKVERRPSYIIDIGSTEIQNKADFRSANQCLKTFYTFAAESETPDKYPKWEHLLNPAVRIERKTISARTKVTTADTFMLRIFDSLLGISDTFLVDNILKGLGKRALSSHVTAFSQREIDQAVLQGLEEIQDLLEESMEEEYALSISPLVFYIGATGLIPDAFDVRTFDSDTIKTLYPHLKIQKNELSGSFFVFDDNIISIFVEDVLVSR